MEDTSAKIAHINAHRRALVLQETRPELFPTPEPQIQNPDGLPENPLPEPTRNASTQPVRRNPAVS